MPRAHSGFVPDTTPEALFEVLFAHLYDLQPMLCERVVLGPLPPEPGDDDAHDERELIYVRSRPRGPVCAREFFLRDHTHREASSGAIEYTFCTAPEYVAPTPANVVRGGVEGGAWLLHPDAARGGVRVTYISSIRLNGRVPAFVDRLVEANESSQIPHLVKLVKQQQRRL